MEGHLTVQSIIDSELSLMNTLFDVARFWELFVTQVSFWFSLCIAIVTSVKGHSLQVEPQVSLYLIPEWSRNNGLFGVDLPAAHSFNNIIDDLICLTKITD